MTMNHCLTALQSRKSLLILIPLALSSFTHLWNAVGFPDIFYDEGVYLRRAMHVLEGLGPQESENYYDHPFFGQLFLAAVFKLINFPGFIDSSNPDAQSVDYLYAVPRTLMGILAVLDTYLIYKIGEKKYGTNVAIVASVLFAVMPLTWITRRIVLDSILLPFLLTSILFALNSTTSTGNRRYIWVTLSGICLGLTIFTKLPMFTIIPLLAYLVISQKNSTGENRRRSQNYKLLAVWFIPVILIPFVWPLESILTGNFDAWLRTVLWQTQRGDRAIGLPWITGVFMLIDPILFGLSVLGGVYAALKKHWIILFWAVPYLLFLGLIGQTNYFHWTPLLPVFCIASSLVLLKGIPRLVLSSKMSRIVTFSAITCIAVLGLLFTTILMSADVSLSQRQSLSYVMSYLDNRGDKNKITVISSPTYSWIFKYVYKVNNTLDDYRDVIFFPIKTPEWILVADYHFKTEMQVETKLQELYDKGRGLASFNSYPEAEELSYPHTSLIMTKEGSNIELKASP